VKINIPSEKEFRNEKRKKRIQGFFGFLAGLTFFGFSGSRIFLYGFDKVEWYTWLALLLGVCSFTFLAYKYGNSFWAPLYNS